MTASEAFRLVGKLWVQQADIRTHWTTQPFSPTKTLRESAAVLRREFLLAFVRGHLPQWYDFSLGWIGGDPRLGRVLRELQTAARKHLDADRTAPRDTLAVVVDETNLYAQRPDRPLMGGPIGTDLRYALGQMGVPYEVFLTSDLTRPKLRRYPAYLFVNCFRLTPEQRQAIEALKSDGRVLAFVYTPGILDDEGYHPERVSSVVGQRLVLEPVEGALRLILGDAAHPLTAGLAGQEFGAPAAYRSGPLPCVEDPAAEVLGRYLMRTGGAHAPLPGVDQHLPGGAGGLAALPAQPLPPRRHALLLGDQRRPLCRQRSAGHPHLPCRGQDDPPPGEGDRYRPVHRQSGRPGHRSLHRLPACPRYRRLAPDR